MNQNKKGLTSNFTCDVCKIDFNTNADYALHEFSKKHCDNLIRLAKKKPIISKQKAKSETLQVEKELPKKNPMTYIGSLAKYGYFIPGEIYANAEAPSKEFNIDYDPYLQKFSENPFKEKPKLPSTNESSTFNSIMKFSEKKKKKIKTCKVCNVTLTTVPEYKAHMKSPQHIWKLKVTGMGVSAHFVKASSDLHTTDINEEPKPCHQTDAQVEGSKTNSGEISASGPFPLLHCSDCKLLFNSPQQYDAHIKGKSHIECAQRNAELKAKKEKLETPSPNQLYCYTCRISLNNLFQYNEHKNGKKHKTKCRNLIRNGISIPPEERVPGIPLLNSNKPVVYPELYEKLVLKIQGQKEYEVHKSDEKDDLIEITEPSSTVNCQTENNLSVQDVMVHPNYSEKSVSTGNMSEDDHAMAVTEIHYYADSVKTSKITFYKNCEQTLAPDLNPDNPVLKTINAQRDPPNLQKDSGSSIKTSETKSSEEQIVTTVVKCSICGESFEWQSQLDVHLVTENHLKKILEFKLSGRSETDLLSALFSDRNVIKPNSSGKLTCSVCNVTTDNVTELDQHLNGIVHKYTQKDYRMKRTIEVKHMTISNEDGLYFCKACKEGWPSLVDYTQHLHFVKHKSIQRAQRAKAVLLAKKRTSHLQKPKLVQNLKNRNFSLRKVRAEKNPGVRTKVCGVAVDLNSGVQALIPNLESLEPKIDVKKNVSIGVCEKVCENAILGDESKNEKVKLSDIKKRSNTMRPSRKLGPNQQRNGPYNDSMAFSPCGNIIPPLMPGPPFRLRFPRPSYAMPNRNSAPFSSPNPIKFAPFYERPTVGNPYARPPWFQRPPWPRHR